MRHQSSKVQALYEHCKTILSPSGSPPPSSQALQKLSSILDTIQPADVGLKEETADDDRGHGFFGTNALSRLARWAQPITYVDIHECDNFTVSFTILGHTSDTTTASALLQASCLCSFIPLHDHPGMTVFSKLLYGSLHVKAYDWVEPPCIIESKEPGYAQVRRVAPIVEKMVENRLRWFGHVERRPVDSVVRRVDQMERRQTIRGRGRPKKTIREVIKKDLELNDLDRIRLAKLEVDKVLNAPCDTSVLYPKHGGNLHCFTAVTPCAMLDILTPPYREEEGRRCTYYHDYPYSAFSVANAPICDGEEEEYAWLTELESPSDLYMRQGVYAGPAIQL
ncbi:Plant cysteine oxidase 3 [Glycine soja]